MMMSNYENDFSKFIEGQQKIFGQDVVFLPRFKPLEGIEFVPIRHHHLDDALGGGIPRGRVIELYGPESSGKTTLALEAVVAFQLAGDQYTAFIDTEHALDPDYASKIGVDLNRMPISQLKYGEDNLQFLSNCVSSGLYSLIVVDSVDAITPRALIDGQIGDRNMANLATLMSQTARKISEACKKTNTTVLFLNQIRHKIGVFFGSPEFTSGGNALKFYASQRIDIRKKETLESNKQFVGIQSKVKIVKNKVAPPFKVVMIDIKFGEGIDRGASQLDKYLEDGIVSKSGNWFSFKEKNVANGRQAALKWIQENEGIIDEAYKNHKPNKNSSTQED
jgi:recombination protein RecA